jgi:hypothetical protein
MFQMSQKLKSERYELIIETQVPYDRPDELLITLMGGWRVI